MHCWLVLYCALFTDLYCAMRACSADSDCVVRALLNCIVPCTLCWLVLCAVLIHIIYAVCALLTGIVPCALCVRAMPVGLTWNTSCVLCWLVFCRACCAYSDCVEGALLTCFMPCALCWLVLSYTCCVDLYYVVRADGAVLTCIVSCMPSFTFALLFPTFPSLFLQLFANRSTIQPAVHSFVFKLSELRNESKLQYFVSQSM